MMKLTRSQLIKVEILFAGIILLTAAAFVFFKFRGSIRLNASREVKAGEITCFTQDDPGWAADTLGTSSYTMASSGCLTTCIASIQNQFPGEMNRWLSDQSAYDAEGNLLWEELEKALEVKVTRQNAGETSGSELEELLEKGIFPILRVRMGGFGNFHYVVLAESDGEEFWCMDPLNQDKELAPLSQFGNRIYAVRYLEPAQ